MRTTPEHSADLDQLKRALNAIQRLRARVNELEMERQGAVAIVGIGCRLPGGVTSPATFWQLLRDGVDAVIDTPVDRWDADAHYDPDPEALGKLPTRRAGFVADVDRFDPQFFGISPREAHGMDPQQRLALQTAWEALEDAGIPPDGLAGSRTGVFIGIGLNDYGKLQVPAQRIDRTLIDTYSATGNTLCITANRLSYLLDLRGPSMAIDTACSSSLVAVHQAVQSLRRGECDLALVGGTNMMLAPETGMSVTRFLSPDGQCKFGDAGANGYVRGEGAVMIVLKPLSRAQADGDLIYVVIRGSAVNQDGYSSGLTVPNGLAQQAVLRDALRDAGVSPEQISYVEAHGTGTSLGDPIEIQAMSAVLVAGADRTRPLLTGSVKSNIGHLEAGAGIAGLVKAALALHMGEIPPSLHFERPNPNIAFDQLGVRVQTELVPWPDGERFAGVSSFGFGGTNAHAILQAAPDTQTRADVADDDQLAGVLLLSGKNEAAVRGLAGRYASWLDDNPDARLMDVLYSAAIGRTHHEHRLALPAASHVELHDALNAAASGELPRGASMGSVTPGIRPKVVFLFTGQGAQYPGMGRQLYDTSPTFRAALDECASLLDPYLERPLLDVLFAEPDSPEAALLDQTGYTQPALFALEYALAQLWIDWGVQPAALAGHSLGEYVAASLAGVFSLEDALRLVAVRGRLMGSLPAGGAMAAVFAPVDEVRQALNGYESSVAIAAVNGPAHSVISGEQAAVESVRAALEAAGVKVRELTVSHAFHSPLMEPMLDAFEAEARQVQFQAARIPVLSNLTGEFWPAGFVPDAGYWVRHIREAVQYGPSVEHLLTAGYELFLEVGPQPVLSGMGRACAGGEAATWLPSLRAKDPQQVYKTLGNLYSAGVSVDWKAVFEGSQAQRLRLPTYPWQNERYWFEHDEQLLESSLARTGNRLHPLIDRRIRTPSLGDVVYEAQLDLRCLPYLSDHRAHETILFPAAAMLEMVMVAGRDYGGQPYEVAELTIQEPLPLDEEEPVAIQVILRHDGDSLDFEVVSPNGNDAWRRHAAGRLSVVAPIDSIAGSVEAITPTGQDLDVEAAYQRFNAIGMQYGPAFRGINRLYLDESTAIGRVSLPSEAGDASGYIIHPALLDACVQVAGALIPESEDVVYLPTSLEGVAAYGKPGKQLWSQVSALPVGDDSTLACSFDIYNDDGEPVASIRRAIFRRASRAALAAAIGKLGAGLPLYEVVWHESPLASSAQPPKPGHWLIFADDGSTADTVAALLVDRGDRVELVRRGSTYAAVGPGRWTLSPSESDDFRVLLREVSGESELSGVIYLWGVDACGHTAPGTGAAREALESALYLAQALASETPAPLWLVTRGAQPAGGEVTAPAQAALWGLARTLRREHPELRPVSVDLDPGSAADPAEDLVSELFAGDDEQEVALRSGARLVARLSTLL